MLVHAPGRNTAVGWRKGIKNKFDQINVYCKAIFINFHQDRKIAAWDSLQNYKHISDTKLPEVHGGIRTIYPQRPGRDDGNIYVGTTKNNIVEGSMQRRFNEVIFGHGRLLFGLGKHEQVFFDLIAGLRWTK